MALGAAVMMIDLIASVQKCVAGFWNLKMRKHVGYCNPPFYIDGNSQAICPGQDTASASFGWHLLEGKSSLEAVVWHQCSKSDTIYHRPLNMETFITSWQENLVENNHLGFDNNLAPSPAPHLDSVLFAFVILYLWTLFITHWIYHYVNSCVYDCTWADVHWL